MREKVFFHLLNLAMVNSFILYREWVLSCNATKAELRKVTQTEFHTQVIKHMITKSGDKITPPCIPKCTSAPGLEIQRLTSRHFIKKIIADRKKTHNSQSCKVCVPTEREEDKRNGGECKDPGHESSYECRDCGVTLCVDPYFTFIIITRTTWESILRLKNSSHMFLLMLFLLFKGTIFTKEMTIVLVSCVTFIFVVKILYKVLFSLF